MKIQSDKAKIIYLFILILFIVAIGFFWLDYIGLIKVTDFLGIYYARESPPVLEAKDDEPSLIEKEEFAKEKEKLSERIEDLDRREARIVQNEKEIEAEKERLDEMKKGLELEKKKLEDEKKRYSGYRRNVGALAQKVESMRPEEAVEIMANWEETLIIDVLRQIDANAQEAGRSSISSYLITLMPRDKASRIMYLMTQI